MLDACWICIVLNKNLCAKGYDKALKEMHILSGDDFIDFKMTDDDFDGEDLAEDAHPQPGAGDGPAGDPGLSRWQGRS